MRLLDNLNITSEDLSLKELKSKYGINNHTQFFKINKVTVNTIPMSWQDWEHISAEMEDEAQVRTLYFGNSRELILKMIQG